MIQALAPRLARPARLARAAFAAALAAAVLLLAPAARAQGMEFSAYQKNMAFNNKVERKLAADIIARKPDFVMLQEVNRDNGKILAMLSAEYPSQQFCTFKEIGGTAVLSRWPLVPGTDHCEDVGDFAALQVRTPEGPVWAISVHLETIDKPFHAIQAADLARSLATFQGPIVIGGDFNDFPGSSAVRGLEKAAGVRRIGAAIGTRPMAGGLLAVPIDFVFASGGQGSVERLPFLGSDHYGVLARFRFGN
ncbi:MAG: hypothetical protein D6801_03380 [Alphaproteobacteria bacterium]|nr:MAG: hypothetical protein D6801_03380 [Alphaproteobacteria bacterium]